MAPWRVLVYDKCDSLRSPQPSTRHGKANREKTGKPNRKRGGAEPSPLTRLGIGCRFFGVFVTKNCIRFDFCMQKRLPLRRAFFVLTV